MIRGIRPEALASLRADLAQSPALRQALGANPADALRSLLYLDPTERQILHTLGASELGDLAGDRGRDATHDVTTRRALRLLRSWTARDPALRAQLEGAPLETIARLPALFDRERDALIAIAGDLHCYLPLPFERTRDPRYKRNTGPSRCHLNDDPTIAWQQLGDSAIGVDDHKEIWHAGCVRDVLVTHRGEIFAATDTGGLWSIGFNGFAEIVEDLPLPSLWCVVAGLDAPQRDVVYFGGDGLYVLNENGVTQIPTVLMSTSREFGPVRRLVVDHVRRRLVAATYGGLVWADIGANDVPLGFVRAIYNDPGGPRREVFGSKGIFGLAPSADGVAFSFWGSDSRNHVMLYARWVGTDLSASPATVTDLPGQNGMGATSIASAPSKPDIMYAAVSDPGGTFQRFLSSSDGGVNWATAAGRLEGGLLSDPGAAGDYGDGIPRPNNCLAVAPSDDRIVMLGWQRQPLFVTQNRGDDWSRVDTNGHVHADAHGIFFFDWAGASSPGSEEVYAATDGGVAVGFNLGMQNDQWSSSTNKGLQNLQCQTPITVLGTSDAPLGPTSGGYGSMSVWNAFPLARVFSPRGILPQGPGTVPVGYGGATTSVVLVGLQDNAVGALTNPESGGPWREFGTGDGAYTLALSDQMLLAVVNDFAPPHVYSADPNCTCRSPAWQSHCFCRSPDASLISMGAGYSVSLIGWSAMERLTYPRDIAVLPYLHIQMLGVAGGAVTDGTTIGDSNVVFGIYGDGAGQAWFDIIGKTPPAPPVMNLNRVA